MKKIKAAVSLLCTAAILLSLTGCTASKESVLRKLTQYIDGRTPTSASVTLELALTTELDNQPISLAVSLDSSIMTQSETASYAEGNYTYTLNDTKVEDTAQVYHFAENGKLLSFTHLDSADRWFRSETELPVDFVPAVTPAPAAEEEKESPSFASVLNKTDVIIPEDYDFLLLEEGTQTLHDTEVYVLKGTLDGNSCSQFLSESLLPHVLANGLQTFSSHEERLNAAEWNEPNYSALSADVVVYLDKKDCHPVQADVTINGANLLIHNVLDLFPAQITDRLGSSVAIEPIHAVFTDIGYDAVTLPTVSEEARMMALQESFDPDLGDGTYVLQQFGDAVKFTAQSDWTISELGYCYATFRNKNNSRAVHIELYRSTTAQQFFDLVESGMIPAMEAVELTPTAAAGENIGEYQTHSITSNGVQVYSACRSVGDSLLGIYVQDSSRKDMNTILTPILESVEDHHLEF